MLTLLRNIVGSHYKIKVPVGPSSSYLPASRTYLVGIILWPHCAYLSAIGAAVDQKLKKNPELSISWKW